MHSDIELLRCDAYLLPTSLRREWSNKWTKLVPIQTRTPKPDGFNAEDLRITEPTPIDGGRVVRFVNTDGGGIRDVDWLHAPMSEAFRLLFDAAPDSLIGRANRLIGMPLFGVGNGGFDKQRREVLEGLLAVAETAATISGHDVVIVCFERADYAAIQGVRAQKLEKGSVAERLGKMAARGELSIFGGAGISAGAGLALWKELIEELASMTKDPQTVVGAVTQLGVLDGASVVREELGEAAFQELLRERLKSEQFALAHALVASLRVRNVFTTNFDLLLERAISAPRPHIKPAVLPWDHARADRPTVVKMHGDIDPGHGVTLTREDFLDYDHRWRPLMSLVQASLLTQHMLFVGFSLRDDNFIRLAHQIRSMRKAAKAEELAKERLGTAVFLRDDPAATLLWRNEFDVVSASDSALPNDGAEVPDRWGARAVDIFLDNVACHAAGSEGSYLLDDRYTEFQTGDSEIAEAVKAVRRKLGTSSGSPSWQRMREFLDAEFPTRSSSKPQT